MTNKMEKLITLTFQGHDIRTTEIEGKTWFVAMDIIRALGLSTARGTYNHLRKIGEEDKRPVTPNLIRGKGMASTMLVSESGMFALINRSDKKEAEPFQDWVHRDVLPSIRKNGGYMMGQEDMTSPEQLRNAVVRYYHAIREEHVFKIAELRKEIAQIEVQLRAIDHANSIFMGASAH